LVTWKQLPPYFHSIVAGRANSVLLQTSRFDPVNSRSILFCDPVRMLTASELDEIPDLFRQIEQALAEGLHVAGYLSYECGYHFESLEEVNLGVLPLAWFGAYRNPIIFHHETGIAEGLPELGFEPFATPSITSPFAEHVELHISEQDYRAKIRRIQQFLETGDTYQVNFTDRVSLPVAAPTDAAFAALLKQQPVAYSAFLHVAAHHILSLSPELFFRIEQGRITTRPMKGTMPRGIDSEEDAAAAVRLQHDEKNRAEHLMIVDLLRNDLGRICTMGSVDVDDIFSVERYATLFQMTSTVSGTLRTGLSFYDIFKALFPSGSITGAPKIRTMQIIRELEQAPRGIYTGAIGYFAPGGASTFNVAIRTLVVKDGQAHMGVGGGIVADSDAGDEYRECKLKAEFLIRPRHDFQLIETMLWDEALVLMDLHMDRLESSASYFDFRFDREAVHSALGRATESFVAKNRYRVRLLLDGVGVVTVTTTELLPKESARRIRISEERTSSRDTFLRHKTTHRSVYDTEYARAHADGFEDVIFINEKNQVTEGAISNIFIQQGELLLTPPLSSGVLPGVFRRHILQTNPVAQECILSLPDVIAADAIYLCSSLRGLRKVKLTL